MRHAQEADHAGRPRADREDRQHPDDEREHRRELEDGRHLAGKRRALLPAAR